MIEMSYIEVFAGTHPGFIWGDQYYKQLTRKLEYAGCCQHQNEVQKQDGHKYTVFEVLAILIVKNVFSSSIAAAIQCI